MVNSQQSATSRLPPQCHLANAAVMSSVYAVYAELIRRSAAAAAAAVATGRPPHPHPTTTLLAGMASSLGGLFQRNLASMRFPATVGGIHAEAPTDVADGLCDRRAVSPPARRPSTPLSAGGTPETPSDLVAKSSTSATRRYHPYAHVQQL
jgi:hypothetical protein